MVLATLTLGLTVSYILDSLDFKPNALFSIWLSLIFTHTLPLGARREVLLEGSKWGGLYLIFLYKNISKYIYIFFNFKFFVYSFFSPPFVQELLAIQQQGPRAIGFFGTRNMGFMHQELIEILSYAMVITVRCYTLNSVYLVCGILGTH
jgi:hypothetical protein